MANNADAIDLMNEVERLRAQVDTLTDVIERIGTTAEARIDAALALYDAAMEIPPLAERMANALRGKK